MHTVKEYFHKPLHKVMAAVFLLVFILNLISMNVSDDLGYSISSGLIDIFHREYIQYMTWTGRSVAHLIARSFLAMPKIIFDCANSVVFCYLIWMIDAHALGTKKNISPLVYALTAALVFLFVPLFGQTVLWETGSCNYLWTTSIILTALYPFRRELEEEHAVSKKFTIGMFFGCIAAGWTNENTGGALILLELLFTAAIFHRKKKVPAWMITGIAGSLLGFGIMIAAPGNKVRSADFINTEGAAYSSVHDLINSLHIFMDIDKLLIPMIILALSICFFIIHKDCKKLFLACAYALGGIACVYAIMLSPVPVEFDRSMFGASILILTADASGIAEVKKVPHGRTILQYSFSCAMLFTLFNYYHASTDLAYTRYQYNQREAWVKQQKAAGNLNPVIPIINSEFFTTYNPMQGLNDILADSSFVNNTNYASVHGLQSVTSTSIDRWQRIYRDGDSSLMNLYDLKSYLNVIAENDDYLVLITTSESFGADSQEQEALKEIGIDAEKPYVTALFQGRLLQKEEGEEPVSMEYNAYGHYFYLNSSKDAGLADILIDNEEYTNDNAGLSIVVFDTVKNRAVDSVTFDNGKGTRSAAD